MQTQVIISGQIMGNSTLKNAISTVGCEVKRGMFNRYILTFKTKGEAIKAMREGYNRLVREEPEMKGRIGGISASRSRDTISYDASRAVISEN